MQRGVARRTEFADQVISVVGQHGVVEGGKGALATVGYAVQDGGRIAYVRYEAVEHVAAVGTEVLVLNLLPGLHILDRNGTLGP